MYIYLSLQRLEQSTTGRDTTGQEPPLLKSTYQQKYGFSAENKRRKEKAQHQPATNQPAS